MWSCVFGLDMYLNIDLPFSHLAHEFSHSIFVFDFIICLVVDWDTGFIGCSLAAPFFARVSALSFPLILQWLGIHCRIRVILWHSRKELILLERSLMAVFSCLCVSKESRHDFESEKITQLLILSGFCWKVSFSFVPSKKKIL